MISYSISEARKILPELLRLVEEEKAHVFLTRYGKVVAVLIPVEEAEKHLYVQKDEA